MDKPNQDIDLQERFSVYFGFENNSKFGDYTFTLKRWCKIRPYH